MKTLITVLAMGILFTSYAQNKKILIDTLAADSIVQTFYKNGKLASEVAYKNGVQEGWHKQYHENGTIHIEDLKNKGRSADGTYKEFHNNGSLSKSGIMVNGTKVLKWYTYNPDGKPSKIDRYNKKGKFLKSKIWSEEKQKWLKA